MWSQEPFEQYAQRKIHYLNKQVSMTFLANADRWEKIAGTIKLLGPTRLLKKTSSLHKEV